MEEDRKTAVAGIEAMGVIMVIVVLAAWPYVFKNVASSSTAVAVLHYWDEAIRVTRSVVGVLVGLSLPLSLFFVIGIVYSVEGLKVVRRKEEEKHDYLPVEPAIEPTGEAGDTELAHRWETVKKHISSENPSDWKQAVIEADIILDDILTRMGYRGESVGEKLKRVESGDMRSLREAWDAHMVRNRIAHDGSAYALNQLEAQEVIAKYKKVFEEFFYI